MRDGAESVKSNPAIARVAAVLRPRESEAPILAPSVRQGVHQWMVELGLGDELTAVGLTPRRTALFSGPPGTGKTTLAHHIAARLGLPLVVVDMAAMVGMYVGETGKNLSTFFRACEEQSDSLVLLLDEFDAIATKRADTGTSAGKEQNAVVVHLLQYVDRYPGTLIAATNRGDDIDPAIWRRFAMHLEIVEPDDECRFAIIKRYLAPMDLPDEAVDVLVEILAGASPALLRQVMEGVKRDLVLAPRFKQQTDAPTVFGRIAASVRPHAGTTIPPLWSERWAMQEAGKITWPPIVPEAGDD